VEWQQLRHPDIIVTQGLIKKYQGAMLLEIFWMAKLSHSTISHSNGCKKMPTLFQHLLFW
jgi:hypothetical protein